MKPRILKSILKDVLNGEPTENERESLSTAKSSLKVARATMVISIALSAAAIYIAYKQWNDSPDKIKMESLVNKADQVLTKDSILISVANVQLDSVNSLNKKFATQLDIMAQLYNNTADDNNRNAIYKLTERNNECNDLVYAITELDSVTSFFRDMRDGSILLRMPSAVERLKILTLLKDKMKILQKADQLMPMKGFASMWDSCASEIINYRRLYIYNITRGSTIDTSKVGQEAFNSLMYGLLNYEDSIIAHIDEARDKIQANIEDIEKTMDKNNKIRSRHKKK